MDFIPEAFLVHADACYVPGNIPLVESDAKAELGSQVFRRGETPVTRLIEGICAQFPNQSRAILRERIFSRRPLTPVCEGMIKVVAKRASYLPEIEYVEAFLNASADGSRIEVSPNETTLFKIENAPKRLHDEKEAAEFARKLKLESSLQSERLTHLTPRREDVRVAHVVAHGRESTSFSVKAVASVLFSSAGEVLAYAWNTNAENRAQHAELNLIRSLRNLGIETIPANSTLMITLKPCAMCAAQILAAAAENISNLKIIYLEDDFGPKAQNSAIMKGSPLWTKAGEPEIRLAHFPI